VDKSDLKNRLKRFFLRCFDPKIQLGRGWQNYIKREKETIIGGIRMAKKKERRPVLEINLNLVSLLESLGMEEVIDRVVQTVQKGKTEILDKFVARVQQGEVKVEVNVGKKKRKVPISFTLKLKKE
jgi:hypothetical protein